MIDLTDLLTAPLPWNLIRDEADHAEAEAKRLVAAIHEVPAYERQPINNRLMELQKQLRCLAAMMRETARKN